MTPWLHIIGIGEDGFDALRPVARTTIDAAEICYGGARHLAMLPESFTGERRRWRTPLRDTFEDIKTLAGRQVVVLATGDPMNFGVGTTLIRELSDSIGPDALRVTPAPGAFSLAAARMGWSLPQTACLSIHGRPLSALALHLYPDARLLALSENETSPTQISALLVDRGFGSSIVTVLSHLDGAGESVGARSAKHRADDPDTDTARLNIVAVDCIADPGARYYSRSGGLPDDAFEHDGQMTKQIVRAATLAALAPFPGAHLWDIGAGCGSISIEWMRAGGQASAVERAPKRRDMIARNAEALGVPDLNIVAGDANDSLHRLKSPDAIFIGGGLTRGALLANCHDALNPGGRLVANAVTLEGEALLTKAFEDWGGALNRIAVSTLRPMGRLHGWRAAMTVTQYAMTKP
jgi:precorrin-6B C5,15-methyltransferase / cobalt-precorrin-6B C5,C15-methyltransferase